MDYKLRKKVCDYINDYFKEDFVIHLRTRKNCTNNFYFGLYPTCDYDPRVFGMIDFSERENGLFVKYEGPLSNRVCIMGPLLTGKTFTKLKKQLEPFLENVKQNYVVGYNFANYVVSRNSN